MQGFADVNNLIAWGFLGFACVVSVVLMAKARKYFTPSQPVESKTQDEALGFDGEASLNPALPTSATEAGLCQESDRSAALLSVQRTFGEDQPVVPAHDVEESCERMALLLREMQLKMDAMRQWIQDAEAVAQRLEQAVAAAATLTVAEPSAEPASSPPSPPIPDEPQCSSVSEVSEPDPASPASAFFANDDAIGMQLLRNRSITTRDPFPSSAPADTDSRPSSQADALRPSMPHHSPAVGLSPNRPASSAGREQRYNEIYVLADYGHSLSEIAQQVAVPVGEVELILSLRDRRV